MGRHHTACTNMARNASHPDHYVGQVESIRGDARANYVERVAHLAIFYFELAEENTDAHSALVRAQLPARALPWKAVQRLFRAEWYHVQRLSITGAALAFHTMLAARGLAPVGPGGIEADICARCPPYERAFTQVHEESERLARAYVRLARCYRRMLREDFTGHSRIAEWFVPNQAAPQNQGAPGLHPEHVVPCAELRALSISAFKDGRSVHEVADMLVKLLVIIWIAPEDRDLLDKNPANLKDRMPDCWQVQSSCIYARLHAKRIAFAPAPGYPCTCKT